MSETAAEPPQDDGNSTNSPRNLALEATFINHNFSQQVLRKEDRFKFDEENPFAGGEDDEEEGEIASVGYVMQFFVVWTSNITDTYSQLQIPLPQMGSW